MDRRLDTLSLLTAQIGCLMLLGTLIFPTLAHAITRADATPRRYEEPIVKKGDLPLLQDGRGVTQFFTRGVGSCSGALITRRHALTAAHCFFGVDGTGQFIQQTHVGGFLGALSASIAIHPDYNADLGHREGGNDIAIVTLQDPRKTTPFYTYNTGQIGDERKAGIATTLGFGRGGNGDDGARTVAGALGYMQNRIDALGDGDKEWSWIGDPTRRISPQANTLVYDFDDPDPNALNLTNLVNEIDGSVGAVGPKEGSGASGDSGGPTFQFAGNVPVITGVTSSALSSWRRPAGLRPSGYGEIVFNTRVQGFTDFIAGEIAERLQPNPQLNKQRRFEGFPVPAPSAIPGLEYSDGLDINAAQSTDPDQVLGWDGQGNVRDGYDYSDTRAVGLPTDAEVDALANVQDALFFDLLNNEANLLFSIDDNGSPILFETLTGMRDVWATQSQINSAGVNNLDALEVGGESGISDANLYSLADDPFGVSAWAYEPESNTSTPYITQAAIAGALNAAGFFLEDSSLIDIDAMMAFDIAGDTLWDMGDWLLFSLEPLFDPATDLTLIGDEVFFWQHEMAFGFLNHGGHLWDTGWLGQNIDALEALPRAVPLPSTVSLSLIAAIGMVLVLGGPKRACVNTA